MPSSDRDGKIRGKQRALWNSSASGWERWADRYETALRPLIEWFFAAIPSRSGVRVLDVAAGAGLPALPIAARLRDRGFVVATDLAAEMLAVAGRRARAAALDHVAFAVADGEHLPFADESFDAVTCAFGLMFYPDPAAALREMRRVLKVGRRFALAVWDDASKNSFFTTAMGPLAAAASIPPVNPDGPGAFRFSSPAKLAAVLKAAGLPGASTEPLPLTIRCDSIEQYWQMFIDGSAPARTAARSLSPEDLARVRQLVATRLQPYVTEGGVRLEAAALCASGTRQR